MDIIKYIRKSEEIITTHEAMLKKTIAKTQVYLNKNDVNSTLTVFGEIREIVASLRRKLLAEYVPTTHEELKTVPKLTIHSEIDSFMKERLYQTSSCLNQLNKELGKTDFNRLEKQILNNLRDILHQVEILKENIEKAKSGVPV